MNTHTHDTDADIRRHKLLAYRIIVPVAALALAFFWYRTQALGVQGTLDAISFPVLFAIFATAAVLLFVYPRAVDTLEVVGYVAFTAYNVLAFYDTVLFRRPDILGIATAAMWLPFLFVITYALMPRRRALEVTLMIYILIGIPGVYRLMQGDVSSWTASLNAFLQAVYVTLGLYIPLLYGIAVLRESYETAAGRARRLAVDAEVDPLTSVANRRALDRELRRALALAERHERSLSVIMFDIDGFKAINDTYGHSVGDTVVVTVSRVAAACLRGSDLLGRWGGDEFLIVSSEVDGEPAALIAERVRAVIEAGAFLDSVTVTASFGVASHEAGDTVDQLVARADAALYDAKDGGRNRVEGALPAKPISECTEGLL